MNEEGEIVPGASMPQVDEDTMLRMFRISLNHSSWKCSIREIRQYKTAQIITIFILITHKSTENIGNGGNLRKGAQIITIIYILYTKEGNLRWRKEIITRFTYGTLSNNLVNEINKSLHDFLSVSRLFDRVPVESDKSRGIISHDLSGDIIPLDLSLSTTTTHLSNIKDMWGLSPHSLILFKGTWGVTSHFSWLSSATFHNIPQMCGGCNCRYLSNRNDAIAVIDREVCKDIALINLGRGGTSSAKGLILSQTNEIISLRQFYTYLWGMDNNLPRTVLSTLFELKPFVGKVGVISMTENTVLRYKFTEEMYLKTAIHCYCKINHLIDLEVFIGDYTYVAKECSRQAGSSTNLTTAMDFWWSLDSLMPPVYVHREGNPLAKFISDCNFGKLYADEIQIEMPLFKRNPTIHHPFNLWCNEKNYSLVSRIVNKLTHSDISLPWILYQNIARSLIEMAFENCGYDVSKEDMKIYIDVIILNVLKEATRLLHEPTEDSYKIAVEKAEAKSLFTFPTEITDKAKGKTSTYYYIQSCDIIVIDAIAIASWRAGLHYICNNDEFKMIVGALSQLKIHNRIKDVNMEILTLQAMGYEVNPVKNKLEGSYKTIYDFINSNSKPRETTQKLVNAIVSGTLDFYDHESELAEMLSSLSISFEGDLLNSIIDFKADAYMRQNRDGSLWLTKDKIKRYGGKDKKVEATFVKLYKVNTPAKAAYVKGFEGSFNQFLSKHLREDDIYYNEAYNIYHSRTMLLYRTYFYLKNFSEEVFILNSAVDFRGRIYYQGILSPSFNKVVRDYIYVSNILNQIDIGGNNMLSPSTDLIKFVSNLNSSELEHFKLGTLYNASLRDEYEVDITSCMVTLMISSVQGFKDNPTLTRLLSLIMSGKFDTHAYTLFLMNKELLKINPRHPWLQALSRADWKAIISPIMYGSKPDKHLKSHILKLWQENSNRLNELNRYELSQFTTAISIAVYKNFINLPAMIDEAYNIFSQNGYSFKNFRLKIYKTELYRKWKRISEQFIDIPNEGLKLSGRFMSVNKIRNTEVLDHGAMRRGILPNYIHSVEAETTRHIISQGLTTFTIHDAYFVFDIADKRKILKEYEAYLYQTIKLFNPSVMTISKDFESEYNNNIELIQSYRTRSETIKLLKIADPIMDQVKDISLITDPFKAAKLSNLKARLLEAENTVSYLYNDTIKLNPVQLHNPYPKVEHLFSESKWTFYNDTLAKLMDRAIELSTGKGMPIMDFLEGILSLRHSILMQFDSMNYVLSTYTINSALHNLIDIYLKRRNLEMFPFRIHPFVNSIKFSGNKYLIVISAEMLDFIDVNFMNMFNAKNNTFTTSFLSDSNGRWKTVLDLVSEDKYIVKRTDIETDSIEEWKIDLYCRYEDEVEFYNSPNKNIFEFIRIEIDSNDDVSESYSKCYHDLLNRTLRNEELYKLIGREELFDPSKNISDIESQYQIMELVKEDLIDEVKHTNQKLLFSDKEYERVARTLSNSTSYWTVDIETFTIDGVLKAGVVSFAFMDNGVITTKSFVGDNCIGDSIEYLYNNVSTNTIIFVHNGSNFDYYYFIKHYLALNKKISIFHRNGNLVFFTAKDKMIKFVDSYKILMASLVKAAKSFGVLEAGFKDEPFHIKFPIFRQSEVSEYINYCEQDAITLLQIIMKFNSNLQSVGLNLNIGSTIASIAYNGFKYLYSRDFVKSGTEVYNLNEDDHNFIKEGYHGGITDVYQRLRIREDITNSIKEFSPTLMNLIDNDSSILAGEIHHFDINSSYPTSMIEKPFPVGKINTVKFINTKSIQPGFYKVVIKLHEESKGLFYDKFGAGLSANQCVRTVVLSHEELAYYTKIKEIVILEWLEARVYSKTAHLFDKWVHLWYDIKSNRPKEDSMRNIAKLFLNSLYGIFGISKQEGAMITINPEGLNNEQRRLIESITSHKIDGETYLIRVTYDQFERIKDQVRNKLLPEDSVTGHNFGKGTNLNVGIASIIASRARMRLVDAIRTVGYENTLYADTDSIVTSTMPNIAIGKNLGEWSSETSENERIILYTAIAPKSYIEVIENLVTGEITESVKFKGFVTQNITYPSLESYLTNMEIRLSEQYTHTSIIDSASFITKLLLNPDLVMSNTISSIKKVKKELLLKESKIVRNVVRLNPKREFTELNKSTYNTRSSTAGASMRKVLDKIVYDEVNRNTYRRKSSVTGNDPNFNKNV